MTKMKRGSIFFELRQLFIDWNYKEWNSEEFKHQEKLIDDFINKQK